MDSPPRRRRIPSPTSSASSYPPRRRVPSPTSFASASSSRVPEDLALLSYISSLSPIKSTKRGWYPQRFSETNLPLPSPVFTSPHMDLQQESSLLTRGNIIAADSNVYEPALQDLHGDSNTLVAPTGFQWVDGRSSDLPNVPTREVNGPFASNIFKDRTSGAPHCEQLGPQIVEAHEDCLRSSRVASKGSFEEACQHQHMHRHFQFEIAGGCNTITTGNSLNSWRPENNYALSSLPESLLSSQQREIFRKQTPVGHSPMLSHFSLCPARTPETLTGMAGSAQHAGNSAILATGNLFTSEVNRMTEDLKTRKRATHTTESGDCKHCNCKRTQCLKLYCDCFAARRYCTVSCACANCFNKFEHQDMVHDNRERIESRDPLAFAPKILNPDTDTIMQDGNWTGPSSARHKRGCNCKKSMCLKKYCECYQAEVGCSDACRCEGCSNSFGIKADRRAERLGLQSHGELNMGGADQFSLTWEGITDTNSGAGTSSASPNPRDFPEVLHAELYRGNNSQTSAGALDWSSSSNTLVPQLPWQEPPQELSSDSARHSLTKDDDTPKTISSPNIPLKACSSNQKCVSPSHVQFKDVMTYEQTIILLGTASAPPLSQCSNYKDGIQQIKSHPNDSTRNQ